MWWTLLNTNLADWETVMASATSDSIRLALLSMASTIRVGARTFVDDDRIKVESRAQATLLWDAIRASESRHRCCLKLPGCAIVAQGFVDTRAIGTNSKRIAFRSEHVNLDIARGGALDSQSHMQTIEKKSIL